MLSGGWVTQRMRVASSESIHRLRAFLVGLPRSIKRALMVGADLVFILGVALLSIRLVNPEALAEQGLPWLLLVVLALLTVLVFGRLGLYRAVVRFLRSRVISSVVIGVTVLSAVMAVYGFIRPDAGISRTSTIVF